MRNLRFLINQAGMSCLDVAKALHVSQQAVYKWETGAAMPSAKKLPLLADVLGCTIDELFGRSPPGAAEWDSAGLDVGKGDSIRKT